MARPNIIVFTGGISGSSVLTNLIAREGYWLGSDTKEVAYKTYENATLVDLDAALLRASGFRWHDIGDLPPPDPDRIRALKDEIDLAPYRAFVEECGQHQPWIWKDPRLCYTAGFWQELMDLREAKIIHMLRDLKQGWIGSVVRGGRCIRYEDLRTLQTNHANATRRFLDRISADYHTLTFEELTAEPEQALDGLNRFLDLSLTLDDLRAVYRGELHRRRWTRLDEVRAWARFFYCSRIRGATVRFPRVPRES